MGMGGELDLREGPQAGLSNLKIDNMINSVFF